MKIFFPLEVLYPSQAGGPANTVYWLSRVLVKKGFQPVLIATDKGISGQVELNRWKETSAGKTLFVRTRFLHFPVGQVAVSLLNFWKADAVHLSSIFFPTAFITAFAARLAGKRMAWSPRGELSAYALNYSGGRKRPILWLIRKLIGDYPLFHSTSDEESENIRTIFGPNARIVQIPNYVELEDQQPHHPGNYLLHLGRIHPKKAIDNLLHALAGSEVFRRSNLKLKIAGRGKPDHEASLKQLTADLGLADLVEFSGQVEGVEKSRLLANAYFTLMPSHSENFGIVVLESLAQGTPVIASDQTPWASLETERIGFWTENSPEKLRETIDKAILMDEAEYKTYRERGRAYVSREFDIRNHEHEWMEFYDRLARGH